MTLLAMRDDRADRVIRWSTAGAVIGVAAVAAVASSEHAYDLVRAHGESGWTAYLVPLTVDGLIYASSMVLLDSARRKAPDPALTRWLLGLGIAATLAAMAKSDPLQAQAAQAFTAELVAGRVLSVRDPRPDACRAAACPAATRISGRAQRHADGAAKHDLGLQRA